MKMGAILLCGNASPRMERVGMCDTGENGFRCDDLMSGRSLLIIMSSTS